MIKAVATFFLVFFFIGIHAQISDFPNISFHKADSIAEAYLGADLKSVPRLSYQLTKDLETDVEKARAIFMWIANNIINDDAIYLKNKRQRKLLKDDPVQLAKWNEEVKAKTIDILLRKKKTVCTGYAFLMAKMCKYAGIKSKIINGYSRTGGSEDEDIRTPNHSWNAVLINNKWYVCDPTWASGIYNPNTNQFEFVFKKGYFLTDPKLFVKNHYPLDPQWTLIQENNPTYEEFTEGPLLYTSAFKYATLSQVPEKMYNTVSKRKKISFQINRLNNEQLKSVYILVSGKRKEETFYPENLVIRENTIEFDHEFLFRGYYDVHVMVDDEPVMTYAFHVKK
jgi:hypothetical protein